MKDRIVVDGQEYQAVMDLADDSDGSPYVIVRTRSAGVFAGYLANRNGMEGRVENARRLWYWSGASTLSELAARGPATPGACKFPIALPFVDLTEIIEVLPVSKTAKLAIDSVVEWTQHDD